MENPKDMKGLLFIGGILFPELLRHYTILPILR